MLTIYVDNTTGEYYRMVEDWNDGSTHRAYMDAARVDSLLAAGVAKVVR